MWEKLNEPIKLGFFLKLMVCFNVIFLMTCWRFAYIGDLEDKETQEYYQYLENRIETQSQLIDVQQKLIDEYQKYIK